MRKTCKIRSGWASLCQCQKTLQLKGVNLKQSRHAHFKMHRGYARGLSHTWASWSWPSCWGLWRQSAQETPVCCKPSFDLGQSPALLIFSLRCVEGRITFSIVRHSSLDVTTEELNTCSADQGSRCRSAKLELCVRQAWDETFQILGYLIFKSW